MKLTRRDFGSFSAGLPLLASGVVTPFPSDPDVVVVGAGPVGVVTAVLLAKLGVSVELWEQAEAPSTAPGAAITDAAQSATLGPAGIWQHLELHPLDHLEVTLADGHQKIDLAPPGKAVKFDQQLFRSLTWDAARTTAGLRFRTGVRVVEVIEESANQIRVVGQTAHGRIESSTSWLVGCDGARSMVRRAIGASFDDIVVPQPWVVAEGVGLVGAISTNHIRATPQRPGTWFGLPGGRVRLEAALRPDRREEQSKEFVFHLATTLMNTWVGAGITLERVAPVLLSSRIASTWRRGRIVLAGDAAHTIPFYLGRGVGLGLTDAAALVVGLPAALEGDENALAAYEQDRTADAREQLRNTLLVGDLAYTFDVEAATARDLFLQEHSVGDLLQIATTSTRELDALAELFGPTTSRTA